MKKYLILCLLIIILSQPAFAKSYSYDLIRTDINFSQYGSVIVSQERDYDFVGSFSYAYLDVLKKGATDVKFLGIKDLDTGEDVKYTLSEDSTHVEATWYYTANYQVKRFLIVYEIDGAVKRYNDVAEFYWKVIEDSHESISSFESNVNLPSSSSLFKVFVHSSTSPGQITFSKDMKTASVSMQSIPANTFVEFRVLTDPSIFPGVQITNENMYQSILNEESTNFYLSGITNSWLFYALIIVVVPALIFLYFYLRYGREPKVNYHLEYEQEPPRDIPPMALSVIYAEENARAPVKGLLATIFDLARRGYIDISEEKKEHLLGLVQRTEQIFKITNKGRNALSSQRELLNFEKDVLSLLFKGMAKNGDEISSSEITKYCGYHRSTVLNELKAMGGEAKQWFESTYFKIYEPRSLKESREFLFVMVPYILIVLAFMFYSGMMMYILVGVRVIGIVFVLFLTFAMRAVKKKTPEATMEVDRWKAFKKYITDFSAMKDAPVTLLQIWDRYLIYAVVLGVAKELLENIKGISLERNVPVTAVGWYHPIGMPGVPSGMMSPESFESFSSNMSGMITALSSSSSVGGGFAGGGGGGGGGGGSGAG